MPTFNQTTILPSYLQDSPYSLLLTPYSQGFRPLASVALTSGLEVIGRQAFTPVFSDQEGLFELGGEGAVAGDGGPVILEDTQ